MAYNVLTGLPDTVDDDPIYVSGTNFVTDETTLFDDQSAFRDTLERHLDPVEAERIVRHEAAHKKAAHIVGINVVQFAIQEARGEIQQIGVIIEEGWVKTRLGLAAVFAAPLDPSQPDIEGIRYLGYRGVNDVVERVLEWNRTGSGIRIPVPLSYEHAPIGLPHFDTSFDKPMLVLE